MDGFMKRKVETGHPFENVWESGYLKWPWYAKLLLPFVPGNWWGEVGADIDVKVKTLFGVHYVVETRVNRNGRMFKILEGGR